MLWVEINKVGYLVSLWGFGNGLRIKKLSFLNTWIFDNFIIEVFRRILCVLYQWRFLTLLTSIIAHICLIARLFFVCCNNLLRSLLLFSHTAGNELIHGNQTYQTGQNYAPFNPNAHFVVVYTCPFLSTCRAHLRIHRLLFEVKSGHEIPQESVSEDNWRLSIVSCRRYTHNTGTLIFEGQLASWDVVESFFELNFEIYACHEGVYRTARCTHYTIRHDRTVPRDERIAQKFTHKGIVVVVGKGNQTCTCVKNGDIHGRLLNVCASESKSIIGRRPPQVIRLHQF